MERQTGTKLGPQTEHSHLLEHTEQTQQQEITRTNQHKHLLQQKTAGTPTQKAIAFNKQFLNTVKHATKRTNRKVDKQTKKLHCEPILISNHQTTQTIKDTKN